jgi:hypothetical protein
MSLGLIGVFAGMGALLAGPVSVSRPLSAPETSTVVLGTMEPAPSVTGEEETPEAKDSVRV